MKHSIIFCYRNREEHLRLTVPYVKSHLLNQGIEHEIVIIEQADEAPFRRASTLNNGVKLSNGEVVVLSDIDYLPSSNVKYYDGVSEVFLPVKRVEFVRNDLTRRPLEDIPSGYRNFHMGVDNNFFGGVITFKREAFMKIGGFNPLFSGWGCEEEDLRNRISLFNLHTTRGDGLFYALDHKDSCPPLDDPNFKNNRALLANWAKYLQYGINNEICVVEQAVSLIPEIDSWYKIKNFDIITDLYKTR